MNRPKECHNWLIDDLTEVLTAVKIDLRNLDAFLYEIDHADCVCEDCMAIAQSFVDEVDKISQSYQTKWRSIKAHKIKQS